MATTRRPNGDGQLNYDTAADRWVGRVPKADLWPGLPKTVSAATKPEATKKLKALRDQHIAARAEKKRVFEDMTVGELVDKYAQTKRRVSKSPKQTSAHNAWVNRKIKQVLADRIVHEVRVADVDDALAALYDSGVQAVNSLSRIREVMSAIFDWAIDRDWAERNPAHRASLPEAAVPAREGVAMTADECIRILGELEDNPNYAIWVMQIYMGLRSGEAAGVLIPDIDFEEGVLHVRHGMIYDEQGKPDRVGEVKTGNRGRGRRTLRMPEAVITALHKRLAERELQRAVYGDQWDDRRWVDVVFVTDKGKPANRNVLAKPFREAGANIGLKVRSYDARHTAATLLAAQGHSLEEIADILGHEDTRMGRSVYTHLRGPRVLDGSVDLSSSGSS